MIKEIKYNNKIIAIIYKHIEPYEKGINFITNQENSLQIGVMNHPKKHIIALHIHNKFKRTIDETQEMIYIESGKIKVIFYNNKKQKIAEEILESGDLINLISEGHGFEMLEESRMIYVKQGPYINKEKDKRML